MKISKIIIVVNLLCGFAFGQTFPNPATLSTGQGTPGSIDPLWVVSALYPNNPPSSMSATYSPALINNNCAPGAWVSPSALPPPINNGNWITQNGIPCGDGTNGYIYFRLQLNLPSACNGSNIATNGNYTLYLSGYVDDVITDVFVNGISQGISGGGFWPGAQLNIALNNSWTSGLNYVDILVKNTGNGPYGLLMVADYSASLNSDLDGDGIADLNDLCPCQAGGFPDGCCTAAPTPTGNSNQIFCNSATVANLSATGTGVLWYASANGGSALPSTTPLVNGSTYYATQTVNACESTNRFPVSVSINSTNSPIGNANQVFCNTATVGNLLVTGTNILWYSSASSTTALSTNTNLINGTTYYASQTNNGCESLNRTPVSVLINTTTTPSGNQNQYFCNYASISDLTVLGNNVQWYSNATGGAVLSISSSLIDGATYYASQTNNNCESINRLPVTVFITSPLPTELVNNQSFCNHAKIKDIVSNGQNIQWYLSSTGGTPLDVETDIISGTTYYSSQTIDGCESLTRSQVVVTLEECDIIIHNYLSLNEDGENDYFNIQGIENYSKNSVEIYNRWGVLVYETEGYNNDSKSFKGFSEGRVTVNSNSKLPSGTYYYSIKYTKSNGITTEKTGYLYITIN
jgi:gliding motility-associated-like protein